MDYRAKVDAVREQIARSCERSGRRQEDVLVIGVSKYVGVEETRSLIAAGIDHLGENRVQSAVPKISQIAEPVIWHFIGNLQTNKVKDILPLFAWIHSLDRLSLAKELQKQADKMDRVVNCLVQVNVSGEQSKSGLAIADTAPFLEQLRGLERIRVKGLMTMAPLVKDAEEVRPVFRRLRELRDSLLDDHPDLLHLSMGMSADFAVAVEEGATMVRLGSILMKP
jgi:pyridoxal phosphate enzyme (YggS family)